MTTPCPKCGAQLDMDDPWCETCNSTPCEAYKPWVSGCNSDKPCKLAAVCPWSKEVTK